MNQSWWFSAAGGCLIRHCLSSYDAPSRLRYEQSIMSWHHSVELYRKLKIVSYCFFFFSFSFLGWWEFIIKGTPNLADNLNWGKEYLLCQSSCHWSVFSLKPLIVVPPVSSAAVWWPSCRASCTDHLPCPSFTSRTIRHAMTACFLEPVSMVWTLEAARTRVTQILRRWTRKIVLKLGVSSSSSSFFVVVVFADLDYVYAQCCGIFVTSTIYFAFYCAAMNNRPRIFSRAILPGNTVDRDRERYRFR